MDSTYFSGTSRLDRGRLDSIRFGGVASVSDTVFFSGGADTYLYPKMSINMTMGVDLSFESKLDTTVRIFNEALYSLGSLSYSSGGILVNGDIGFELSSMSLNAETLHQIICQFESEVVSELWANGQMSVCVPMTVEIGLLSVCLGTHQVGLILTSELSSETAASPIYMHRYVQIQGPFLPGETIVIDSDKFTVIKGSQNWLDHMSGDFFVLTPGINTIRYIDSGVTREVFIQIGYEERVS